MIIKHVIRIRVKSREKVKLIHFSAPAALHGIFSIMVSAIDFGL